jgi:hypothetical protein
MEFAKHVIGLADEPAMPALVAGQIWKRRRSHRPFFMKEMVDSVRHELSRVADNYREIATRLEIGRQVLELTAQETMLSGYQRYRCMCLVARPRFRFKHSSGSYVCGGMSIQAQRGHSG